MSVSGSAISAALSALHQYSRRVDQAAARIATAGLGPLSTDPAEPPTGGVPAGPPAAAGDLADLTSAMTSMMIAQRAFTAQLQVLRTADDMLQETVKSVG